MAETEAPVVPTPVPEETQVEEKAASKPASKAKAAPKAKKPAVAKKPKAARSYPSFEEMITEAIKTLKERTGSSQIAIAKCIEDKHKNLPSNFRKLLLIQSKRLVASGKLVKVKASFKLPSRSSSTAAAAAPVAVKKPAAKSKVAAKPKAATTKAVAKPKAKADGD
ncbi:unnamed protein product [Linum tenue]|uniref:H15 domain-containing protein n=1 Tax=Linum tenue TaxID=586396 RepID=A0AAV0RPR5_9ROSI|nr:unnamed protein product [Linum tenue]